MTDADWIKSLDNIKDPKEALTEFLDNERFLGYDPYYGDLRVALIGMLERIRDGLPTRVQRTKGKHKAPQARRNARCK